MVVEGDPASDDDPRLMKMYLVQIPLPCCKIWVLISLMQAVRAKDVNWLPRSMFANSGDSHL